MEDRSKYIVTKGNGIAKNKNYPTVNIYTDFDNGIYHCECIIKGKPYYGIMSVINRLAEIHVLGLDEDCYGESVIIEEKTMIDKDLIINAIVGVYGDGVFKSFGGIL